MADDDVKWIDNIERMCDGCGRKKRHDRGVRMRSGKQVVVVECVGCHEVTEATR